MKFFEIAAAVCAGLLMATALARAGSCGNDSPVLQRLEVESILEDVALVHSLDPTLLTAIARVESGECVDAISPKGAVGLMQLMPATASTFGVEDRFDPVQNALGAARFIDYLKRDRPEGRLTLPRSSPRIMPARARSRARTEFRIIARPRTTCAACCGCISSGMCPNRNARARPPRSRRPRTLRRSRRRADSMAIAPSSSRWPRCVARDKQRPGNSNRYLGVCRFKNPITRSTVLPTVAGVFHSWMISACGAMVAISSEVSLGW